MRGDSDHLVSRACTSRPRLGPAAECADRRRAEGRKGGQGRPPSPRRPFGESRRRGWSPGLRVAVTKRGPGVNGLPLQAGWFVQHREHSSSAVNEHDRVDAGELVAHTQPRWRRRMTRRWARRSLPCRLTHPSSPPRRSTKRSERGRNCAPRSAWACGVRSRGRWSSAMPSAAGSGRSTGRRR